MIINQVENRNRRKLMKEKTGSDERKDDRNTLKRKLIT